MVSGFLKLGKNVLLKGGKMVADTLVPTAVEVVAKVGNEVIEHQKTLIKIPDLQDANIDEAMKIINEELNLIGIAIVAKPHLAYANENANTVVYGKPRFKSKVAPKTTVKLYYLTQEIIDESKELTKAKDLKVNLKNVIGSNIDEAREELEYFGVRVTEKLEAASTKWIHMEEGQVTRVTYPNDAKNNPKFKSGDRAWVYYVDQAILSESKKLKEQKDTKRKETMTQVESLAKNTYKGAVDGVQSLGAKVPFPVKDKSKHKELANSGNQLESEDIDIDVKIDEA